MWTYIANARHLKRFMKAHPCLSCIPQRKGWLVSA